jgi:hypothetical protein
LSCGSGASRDLWCCRLTYLFNGLVSDFPSQEKFLQTPAPVFSFFFYQFKDSSGRVLEAPSSIPSIAKINK